jgi:hypothetical protein
MRRERLPMIPAARCGVQRSFRARQLDVLAVRVSIR